MILGTLWVVFHVFLPLRLLFHERKKQYLRGAQNSNQIFSMAIAQNTLLQGGFGNPVVGGSVGDRHLVLRVSIEFSYSRGR